jgi:WS/DGAT/MGAT family acyltransferase
MTVTSMGGTSIDRLPADDRVMLWGDEIWPQEIGALAILDGAPLFGPDGRFRIEELRVVIESRLHLVPRFRQLLCVPRRGLGGPLWVDAPELDVGDHVRVTPLPEGAGEASLLVAVERLRRQRLDRSRPLWGMWFLPGLADGRVGLFVKMHHVIADGIAGVATFGAFLDPTLVTALPPARRRTPRPAPAAGDLLADHLRRQVEGMDRAFSKLARPLASLREARTEWSPVRELLTEPPTVETSLNRMVGPDRTFALVRSDLDRVKEVAHGHDAKVNDVLLAAIAGGLRGLLRARGESVDGVTVRIGVPVSLRLRQGGGGGGNRVGEILVPLPLGVADPSRRLRDIAAETAIRKERPPPSVGRLLRTRVGRRLMLRALDRQRLNVTSADVPGPPMPLNLAGAPVLEVFPILPLIWKVSLGVGAMSYAGQFNLMAVADRDACPDLEVFASAVHDELAELGVTPSTSSLAPAQGR